MADGKPIHVQRFEAAVKVIQSLPKNGSFQPSNEMMLKFYSYYKQATMGPCNIPRPGFWDPTGKYKWDAWNSLGDMSKDDAMIAYVEEMKKIIETMPMTEKVEELLQVIGPFYEIVEDKKSSGTSVLTVGRLEKVARSLEGLDTILSINPNCMKLNGKKESSDSGAESDKDGEDDMDEEEDDKKDDENYEIQMQPMTEDETKQVKILLANGNSEKDVPFTDNSEHIKKSMLNSEKSEEILNQKNQALEFPELLEMNGHITEPIEDVGNLHHLTSDSDSEVYCDSMEQFGQDECSEVFINHSFRPTEGNPTKILSKIDTCKHSFCEPEFSLSVIQGGAEGVKCGGEDGKSGGNGGHRERMMQGKHDYSALRRGGRGSKMQASDEEAWGFQQGSGGDGERRGTENIMKGGVLNEQIAVTLIRLQEDMHSVLLRLNTLEALSASQARSQALSSNYHLQPHEHKKPSWWPFSLSPGMLAFAIIWPFVAQWLIRQYARRRRRPLQ
ncbi:acyl-CoA-binding domain-containing protein 5A isoform X1 [Polypterus senegalus]|uniref:acyl-CoA-binding domain-containing protein 5A isoform X1 n=1 Tax=Polypterus senegalus TaxID=55291 RepID=UPI0019662D41|nr:acyl-CoA-binding domain-containing protein 5A isoform X1 [Polypterus senegalus]